MEEFNHLQIQLKDINLEPNIQIGVGGFGPVYKGELSRPEGLVTVACKFLNRKLGQGNVEFLKEIIMLSKYKHKNLISLLHFCIEGDTRILVCEYASHGSLDRHLNKPSLTWTQRLMVCVGVARALKYLHDPTDTHQRIFHRDIKSSNILLDEEWNAKVSDFGLSKFGPANQPQTFVVSNVVGTPGYCDPLYWKDGILSKESDVYSFGVVMFEVMCGRLCCEYNPDNSLKDNFVPKWKKCFEEERLDDIIYHGLKEHMEPGSLHTFSTIAYQCLKGAREDRPTMAEIVEKLEMALEQQEVFEDIGKRMNFEKMRRMADLAVSPLSYITQSQLLLLFMKGMLVDDGKTWFSVNKKGQHCELISAPKCVSTSDNVIFAQDIVRSSRFQHLLRYVSTQDLRLKVKTKFLSPNVTYIINLVYDYNGNRPHHNSLRIPFKYKLGEMRQYVTSCVACVGEGGWRRTELFQFTSTKNEQCFDIHFSSEIRSSFSITIEGVEFFPVNFETNENKVDHMQPGDIDWGERLQHDYIRIVKWSKDIDESMTKREVYFVLRKGLYINNSQQWFSISKKSKKRVMLPARAVLPKEGSGWNFLSLPGSRFNEAAESCDNNNLEISIEIESQLLSTDIRNACYLVFKLPEKASEFEGIVIVSFETWSRAHIPVEHHVYLVTPPHTPILELSPSETPPRTRKVKGHPKLRKDGWMEIQVFELYNANIIPAPTYSESGYLKSLNEWNFTGLLVQGIELRPAKVSWKYSTYV